MMGIDCPLAIRHKKGEYIWMEIGGDFQVFGALDCMSVLHPVLIFFVLELWSIRLYQGASLCTFFFFFWLVMYLF